MVTKVEERRIGWMIVALGVLIALGALAANHRWRTPEPYTVSGAALEALRADVARCDAARSLEKHDVVTCTRYRRTLEISEAAAR